MSVRPVADGTLRPLRLLLALLVVATVGAAPVRAETVRAVLGFDEADVFVGGTAEATTVQMKGLMAVGAEGEPELPMAVKVFHVPAGYRVSDVRVTPLEETRIAEGVRLSLRSAAMDPGDILSARRPLPSGELAEGAVIPSRSAVSLGGGSFGGVGVHSVGVFPVRWDSATNELVFTRTMDVEVNLVRDAAVVPDLVRQRPAPHAEYAFAEAARAIVANPEDLPLPELPDVESPETFRPRDLPSTEGSGVDMVIVTTAALEADFQPLADWKTKKGIPTVIRTTEWIDTNYPAGLDRPHRIRLFLKDAYEKWGTYMLLIGGDFTNVPPREAFNRFFFGGTEIPTDQYYACLEGNWNSDGDDLFGEGLFQGTNDDLADLFPDLFTGRAAVETPAEVQNFVTKSFKYEKTPPANYVKKVCYLAEVLFPEDWEYGEDPPEIITLNGATLTESFDTLIPLDWTRTKCYQTDDLLDRPHALSQLNAGQHHLMTLMNHGDAFKFSVGNGVNPQIFSADTDALSNGDYLMFVMATACNPNQIDLECQGESFMNNSAGAIGVVGPTREDFPLSASDYHEEMLRVIFDSGITRFGAMSQVHRVPFVPLAVTDATPDRWTMLTKMLLGDPEIRFWTEEPANLVVTHAGNLPLGTADVTVTVTDGVTPVADAVVCVSDANGSYARGRTDASGVATLPLSSAATGDVDVVVTAENFIPSETTVTLDAIAGAHLELTDIVIDDDSVGNSSGNGDGVIDLSEVIELGVTATNGGGATATGVSVNAAVEAGTQATFNLLWGGVADTARVFIGPDRVNPAAIPFTLDFDAPSTEYIGTPPMAFGFEDGKGDQGIFLWQDQEGWHLRWSSADSTVQVTGSVATDGRVRGMATPLLEAGVDVATINAGEDSLLIDGTTGLTDLSDGVDFALADNTKLSVTTASDAIGDIGASSSGAGTVVLTAANDARPRQIAYVDLTFTSTTLATWTEEVALTFAGPELEAYVFAVDDSVNPPVNGNGNGVVEVGETVRLTPTVLNRGDGYAGSVSGSATAATGITFLDTADAYGDLAANGQSSGADGYVFTVDDGTGTTLDLTLTDSIGRSWVKTMDFVAPAAPDSLRFRSTPSAITPIWDRNAESDLAGYNVYRSATSGSGHTRQNFELVRDAMRYEDSGLAFGSRYFYYVTAVDSSGNEGPASAEIEAWTTQVQLPGWPRSAGNNVFSSIAVGDTDGLPGEEVYAGSKDFKIYGWSADGSSIGDFPINTMAEAWGTPALADLDEDGDLEVLCGSNDSRLYVTHHDGSPVYGANTYLLDLVGTGALMRGAPTVADVDFDSELEMFVGTDNGRVYAFNADGTGYTDPSGLFYGPVLGTPPHGPLIWGAIACADWDGDGDRELAFACRNDSLYVVDHLGNDIAGFPRGHSEAHFNGPVFADLDNDGTMELVVGTESGDVYAYNHDGTGYLGGNPVFTTLPGAVRCIPAPCNLDGDAELELVITCMDGDCYIFNHDGTGFLNPGGLFVHIPEDGALEDDAISTSPIVVDVDGDSDFEIFFGHRNFTFYGFHHDGTTILGMPIPTSEGLFSTAAAGDLDNDGDVEVVFGSYDSFVNVLDFDGAATPAAFEWPTFAGSATRRSVYGEIGPYQTGVDPGIGVAPLAFALAQNTPNPFVQGTRIGWTVPRDMEITLRIFNIEGRLVRELMNGPVTAGAGFVDWDGRDTRGARLSSGIYFYQLQGPQDTATRKSVLLR